MSVQRLEYIGSKFKLLDWITEKIKEKTEIEGKVFGDLFSGTGIVGHHFRKLGCVTLVNDAETYSRIIGHAMTISVYTDKCKKFIELLNNELENKLHATELGFITANYSPCGECERMFFTEDNARRIDYIRRRLVDSEGNFNEDENKFLLASLLMAADKVSNVTSVYGAYLKQFKKRSLEPLVIVPVHELTELAIPGSASTKKDVLDGIEARLDIAYLDPPYNNRQYSKNYFPLNMIAVKDKHPRIKGKTGIPLDCFISPFCKKNEVEGAFKQLFDNLDAEWVFLSYSSESLVSKDRMIELMTEFGEVTVEERDYKRFKSASYNEDKNVIEYLFCLKKIPRSSSYTC